ncbi:MAG: TraR/DksA C4-type zinc finger protein [Candidatus Omnitrophica bacterium]|nr:TraR/DksA C4-type zinc finger protein [Candidatus Omnitrophota bacterium]MDD5429248.1 TraR/DksA C4-type zinc finger protein [Candidatus Omnitrophota bacterium]
MKKTSKKQVKRRFVKKELEAYKEKLLDLKDDIMRQMKDISEDTLMKTQKDVSGDFSGYGLHMADVATDNYERDFNLGLVSNERKTIMEIDEALKRIEDGTYGICQMSGKPIAKTRLNAIPYAKYTKKCQEQREQEDRQ